MAYSTPEGICLASLEERLLAHMAGSELSGGDSQEGSQEGSELDESQLGDDEQDELEEDGDAAASVQQVHQDADADDARPRKRKAV